MNKVFFPLNEQARVVVPSKNEEWQREENYLNLWSYLRRRYPGVDLEEKKFSELIQMKVTLEGPRQLREWDEDIASVRKH